MFPPLTSLYWLPIYLILLQGKPQTLNRIDKLGGSGPGTALAPFPTTPSAPHTSSHVGPWIFLPNSLGFHFSPFPSPSLHAEMLVMAYCHYASGFL